MTLSSSCNRTSFHQIVISPKKRVFALLSLVATQVQSASEDSFCRSGSCARAPGRTDKEVLSDDEVALAEDADADAIRFSLMQKASPQLLQTSPKTQATTQLLQVEATEAIPFWMEVYPYDKMRCASQQAVRTESMTGTDYDEVVASVHGLYNNLSTTCNTTYCPQSDWAGCVLRLAAHDFMDQAGSDGCLYLNDGDNAGLAECLYKGSYDQDLGSAYEKHCSWLSLADFIVIAGEAVMNITRQNLLSEVDSTRQPLDFRSRFKYGRVTSTTCRNSLGQMPDAERGCNAVEDTMLRTMGLNWTLAAALMGGHTLGEAKLERSGYAGRWKEVTASRRFDNGYYTSMIFKGWGPDESVFGNPLRNQWTRVDIGGDSNRFGREMMLDSDMCLYFSSMDTEVPTKPLHAKTVKVRDNGCNCAWARTNKKHKLGMDKYNDGMMCGHADPYPATARSLDPGHRGMPTLNTLNFTKQRALCCSMQHIDTYDPETDCHPFGPASSAMTDFSNDEELWLAAYADAWGIATTRNHPMLTSLKIT
mmetsp:Transcript_13932/g.24383  ORF Transcript_13932/g.24383 Transcript_13932/m.24383 type:complete len:534 (+) Transcript_13932:47-1648(+)